MSEVLAEACAKDVCAAFSHSHTHCRFELVVGVSADFTEIMRALGYPRLISVRTRTQAYLQVAWTEGLSIAEQAMSELMNPRPQVENFRTPNFALVAHILYWLVERCERAMAEANMECQHS